MKQSYEADERTFQKLRTAGVSSWDEQADPQRSFETFIMRPFLEESLATLDRPLNELSALEIGCGSGPIACFLAGQGLAVRGIDVSPTALEMAREQAAQRSLSIPFDHADIVNLPEHPHRYDLVIDGHCLHYFVLDEHRRAALTTIKQLLKPAGQLLIETMISHPDLAIGAKYRIDEQCVLSIAVDDPAEHNGAFESDGMWFAPYRRLLTAEMMLAQLQAAGFTILSQRPIAQADPRKPMLFQIRAGL